MISLRVVDAAVAKQADRGCIGYKLSDGLFAHPLRNPDNSLDHKPIYRVDAKRSDELAIDLDVIKGKFLR